MSDSKEVAEQQASLAKWIKAGKIEMSSTHLLLLDPDLSYDDYEDLGRLLAGFHRTARWWIGDWILMGERTYGEMYAQAMEVTQLSKGALMNYVSVCKAVPRSRRRIDLPFSVHAEIAPLTPSEQKHWLGVASREGLGQRELRERLQPVKGSGSRRTEPQVIDDLESLARSIVKQAIGDGNGRYLVPGELIMRLAQAVGEV